MKILILFLMAISCNYKKNKLTVDEHFRARGESRAVSFKEVKEQVFVQKCIGCHGNSGGVNLESYPEVKKHLDLIRRSCLEGKTMPKSPMTPLTGVQFDLLADWVDAGGLESPVEEDESEESTALDFERIKKDILVAKCLMCHRKGEHAGNVPFETRDELISSPLNLVVPGRPEESLLYTITAPGARNMMPPIGVEPLSKLQREMLQTWITKGAN